MPQSAGRAVGKTRFNRIDALQFGHGGMWAGNVIGFRSWTALTLQPQLICHLLYEFVMCLTAINHSDTYRMFIGRS